MEITWYGHACFRLKDRNSIVVTDPYDKTLGLPVPRLKADIVTISHSTPHHNHTTSVKGDFKVVDGPGEYEIGGVFIIGILMTPKKSKKANSVPNMLYVFDFDGLTVAHLGDLAYVPSQAQIEDLGTVDIALVPVGGGSALSPSQAAEVISLIEPSIVVPMHYKTGKLELKLGTVKRFLSEMGMAELKPIPSLKVTKSSLSEETQVVVLEPPA